MALSSIQHLPRIRFFTPHQKWRKIQTRKNAGDSLGVSDLHPHHHPPLHPPLPLRRRLLLPRPPLPPVLRTRPPPVRHLPLPFAAMTTASSQSSPDSGSKTVRVVVKGRVQGVFYRNWTIENANQLGLKGWVRNRRDGSVEALFSGKPNSVDEMQQRCRRGPPAAVVTGFDIFPCADDPGSGFERKPTV